MHEALGKGIGEGHLGIATWRRPWEGPHEGAHACVTWKPYAIIADLPLAELKGIQARAYAELAKGIFSRMAL